MNNKLIGFYLNAVISNVFFFLPIYSILFYESLGFSLTQIGILIALIPLSSLISEIPTGIFADKFGRKTSTLIGYGIVSVSYLLIFFFSTYAFLVFANVLIGFGITFVTGAHETWMSDLVSKNRLSSFFARLQSLDAIGTLLSGFIGVLIVSNFGLSSIWLCASFSYFLGVLFFLLVPSSNKSSKEFLTFKKHVSHLKDAVKEVHSHKRIRRLVLSFLILGFAYAFATNLAWIPFIESLGLSDANFGYVWTLMALMGIFAPYVGQYFEKRFSTLLSLRVLVVLLVCSFLLVYFVHTLWFALLLLILTLLFDQGRIPLEKAYLQSFLSQKRKSTITSLQSLLMSLGLILGYPLVGLIADTFSSKVVLVIAGLLFLPLIYLYRN